MSSPQKNKQPASRWAFLSQAVASVESRLDNILADEEEGLKRPTPQSRTPKDTGTPSRGSSDLSRSDSTNRNNDRLQARLAQAMAKKNASRVNSPGPPSEPVSGTATPTEDRTSVEKASGALDSAKQSLDNERNTIESGETQSNTLPTVSITEPEEKSKEAEAEIENDESKNGTLKTAESTLTASQRTSSDDARISREAPSTISSGDPDATLLNAQIEHENTKSQMQEEIDGYMERIDALHAKLQYLTKEASDSARQSINAAESGSAEKKVAEKDEKIALLMEEGQKLSKNEMKHLTIIKKLRSQANTSSKDEEAVRQRAQKAERALAVLEEKSKQAEAVNRRSQEKISTLSKSSQDLEAITRERNALNNTLAEVRTQLSKANKRAEEAESKAQSDKLEVEKRKNTELQDDLSSAKIERELAEGKLKRELQDLKTSLEREREQTRLMETEMLAEQAALESKLESFRVRAEEASSSDHGDMQAKLLRQVETLQSQYAAASQNWQGIEGTLLARITNLEKERDEVVERESELRRKLREATLKAKNNGKELEDLRHNHGVLQDEKADDRAETLRLTRRNEQLEEDLSSLRRDTDEQRARFDRDITRRIEEEKAKWTASLNLQRTDSPTASTRKSSTMDNLMSPGGFDRPISRRSSIQHPFHDTNTPPRQYSLASMRGISNGAIPETPSIGASFDQDEFFVNVPATPASPTNADSGGGRGVQDVISASTVGAGPSVQLVERMSANVRRLESEKAASKDEITRLSSQRDEARQEVVNLMREIEQKRNADERLQKLEEEHKALNEKHQATLEMLGEKSEQVEELKADIVDVKQMYRQLADTMGK